jgi:menaquinone-9 beta-reductase
MMRSVDIAVVGGGPAGAAAAAGLAAAGREVLLIERTAGPHHKVCGEFLSAETCDWLVRLGIDAHALGGVPIDTLSLRGKGRDRAVALPFQALSLSRYRLDESLLERAAERGARLARGTDVRAVERRGSGWRLQCGGGAIVECRHLVLATGKRAMRGAGDARDRSMGGLKMHLRPAASTGRALAGRVELCMAGGGYAGLELVEEGIANLCLLLPRAVVAGLDPGWAPLRDFLIAQSPCLGERLDGAEPLWASPMAVVCPVGGHVGPAAAASDGAFRVGDCLAHIPPFTGDGIAIALCSAELAVEHIRVGADAAAYAAAARWTIAPPIRRAGAVSWLVGRTAGRAILSAAARMPGVLRVIARKTRIASPAPR